MKVVLDVNIILSALIRDSITRKIILTSDFEFYFPEIALYKIRKYEDYIIDKAGLDKEGYQELLTILFENIKLIKTEEINKYWIEAKDVMDKIDEEDTTFIAAAIAIENSIIWSDDTHFEKQDKIRILKTKEILEIFKNKTDLESW